MTKHNIEPGPRRDATGGTGLGAIAANVSSLLTSNVINRATSFIVYAMVARYLGARELGQLVLAVSFFQLGSRFALLGLETLTTREVAKDRARTGEYLPTASVVVVVTSVISLPVIWSLAELLNYSADTKRVILYLFVGMAPFTLSQLTEATFVGWERSKFVAYSNSPIWIAHTAFVFLLLNAGYGADAVALAMAATYAVIAGVHWVLLISKMGPLSGRVNRRFPRAMLKSGLPFLGIQGMNAIRASIGIVFLSTFAGETAVGIFAAANQLLIPLSLIFQATGQGVFPAMVRNFKSSASGLQRLSRRLTEFTLALAIPAAAGLYVLAGPLLLLVYGDSEFLDSVVVLRILAVTLLFKALTAILGQILWASHRETTSLRIALTNTIVMVVAALILIPAFDVVGAALASLFVGTLHVIQHYVPVSRLFESLDIVRVPWKPVAAAVAMVGFLLAIPDAGLWLQVTGGAIVYLLVLFVLYMLLAGGYAELKSQLTSTGMEG